MKVGLPFRVQFLHGLQPFQRHVLGTGQKHALSGSIRFPVLMELPFEIFQGGMHSIGDGLELLSLCGICFHVAGALFEHIEQQGANGAVHFP